MGKNKKKRDRQFRMAKRKEGKIRHRLKRLDQKEKEEGRRKKLEKEAAEKEKIWQI